MTVSLAVQRLEASRAAIRAELTTLQPTADAAPDAASSTGPPRSLFDTTLRALRLWWRRHPARPLVDITLDAGTAVLKPLVRQHPLAALTLAVAAGAAMVVWRPWRSRVTAAVWAGLGAQLTAGLLKSIVTTQTLSALLGHLARAPAPNPPSTSNQEKHT